MKIFSQEELDAIVTYTMEEEGLTPLDMIERVSENVACQIISHWQPGRPMVFFAGGDRCGAYTLETARQLLMQGYRMEIILFNIGGERLSRECRMCRDRLLQQFPEVSLDEITGLRMRVPELTSNHFVVDGIFGSELTRPLVGGYVHLVREINDSGATIVSIDLPSGLLPDWNSHILNRNTIHASLTLVVGAPRISFFMKENAELTGAWEVIDIGLNDKALRKAPWKFYLVQKPDIKRILRRRDIFASKADFGDAMIYAGSYGMMGAAVLSARAALRSGLGKLTVHSPKCGYFVMQTAVPCAMFEHDPGDTAIQHIELRRDYKAVALGPGMGTDDATVNALDYFLKVSNANSRPLLLDADALNCIAVRPSMLDQLPVYSIITPHAGEFDRLFGAQPTAEARLLKAIEVAQFYRIIIVLKGHYTAVVRPDGKVYFNSTGTPAMATPGSGDVLTGILTGLLAQGYKPEIAAFTAVFIHGLAGEIAEQRHGQYGVTADDIAEATGQAIKSIME